jgi:hypothetical protein
VSARTVSVAGFRVQLPELGQHRQGPIPAPMAAPVPTPPTVVVDRLSGLIVGNQEISQRTGASKALIHSWTSKPHRGFPAPLVRLAAGPLYWWPEVSRWLTTQAETAPEDRRRHVLALPVGRSDGPDRPPYLPLVGVAEIAALADVQNTAVCNWRQRYATREPRFPASLVDLAMGPIYCSPDIERWLTASEKPATLAGAR